MNNIHYIYKYDKLKYGLFIDSSITSMHYLSFYTIYKNAIRAQIFRCPPTYMPLVTSNYRTSVHPE